MAWLNENDISLIANGGIFSVPHEDVVWLAQQVLELRNTVKTQQAQLNKQDDATERLKRIGDIVDSILREA